MIKQYHSPLESFIKQQQYKKHLQRITNIIKRNKTADYHLDFEGKHKPSYVMTKGKASEIEASNDKLYRKLQQIRLRKSQSISLKNQASLSSPFQKKQKRRIQEQNMKMVDKMISMKCVNSYQKIRKDIQQYNKRKNMLRVNRSISLRFPDSKLVEQKVFQ